MRKTCVEYQKPQGNMWIAMMEIHQRWKGWRVQAGKAWHNMMKLYHGEHQRNLQKTTHVLLADTHVDNNEQKWTSPSQTSRMSSHKNWDACQDEVYALCILWGVVLRMHLVSYWWFLQHTSNQLVDPLVYKTSLLSSGKSLHNNRTSSVCFIGKLTINGHVLCRYVSYVRNHQRVFEINGHFQ